MPFLHDSISGLRKILLAPLALVYAGAAAAHRRLLRRSGVLRRGSPTPDVPLIVIGSLRAGGAGKTPVTLELARRFAAQGKRVGILVYRIGGSRRGVDEVEVLPGDDWRDSSDEAILLARRSGARVFATRDRAATWRRLSRSSPQAPCALDVLLADDGLMDPRLEGAYRVALVRPGENPGIMDLLPAGPYRLTGKTLSRVNAVLTGPMPESGGPGFSFSRTIASPGLGGTFLNSTRPEKPQEGWWLLCGLANPAAVLSDLRAVGILVAGVNAGPNHGLPDLAAARRAASRAAAAGFLFTAKDGVKLEGKLLPDETVAEITERIEFSPAFLSAVDAITRPPTS